MRLWEVRFQKALRGSLAGWDKLATRQASLLMILHKCHEYYAFAEEVTDLCDSLAENDEERVASRKESALSIVDKALSLLESLSGVSPTVMKYIEDLGDVYDVAGLLPSSTTLSEMLSVREMVRAELESRKFLLIPSPDAKKIRQIKPFGNQIYKAFPSARTELTNAGTAFAVELHTASVFHLMRATEIAMRALCNDRGITQIKGAPVHMMQWHQIITALEAENQAIANWPNSLGEIKVQAQEFYCGAAAQFRGLKDEWRNHVSHTRTDYSRRRAEDATDHVKRLMQTLSSRISETTRTPKVWTAAELR